jgi:3-hydroxyacyl-CoA dehydrogenase
MDAQVEFRSADGIGVLIIDRPPVNALNQALRQQIFDAVKLFQQDNQLGALVIAGKGAMFSAGADITEFASGRQPPSLADIMLVIEASNKPVVAAIHGSTLGGGFELALACPVRIGSANLRVGLPEVKLGLLPGAGGTQRLPRVIDPATALSIIATGRDVHAEEALSLGIIQSIFTGDPVEAGVAHAKALLRDTRGSTDRPSRESIKATPKVTEAFEAMASSVLKHAKGRAAPAACVQSVRNALSMPLAEGLAAERTMFDELQRGDESKALRHLFFSERAAGKTAIAGVAGYTQAPEFTAAVIGAGLMGGGIAVCLLTAGIRTVMIDPMQGALAKAKQQIEGQLQRYVNTGRLTLEAKAQALIKLELSERLGAAAAADFVIEAAPEILTLKGEIFAELSRVCRPDTVLATNTSSLDVDAIAEASSRPEAVIGMHFFSPAHAMRLVEVIRGRKSSDDVLAKTLQMVARIKKVGAVVGVCNGFVANRMMGKRTRQVDRLLLEGATPSQIDRVTTAFGFPMGPLAVGDLAGLDVGQKVRLARNEPLPVADALCAAGRFGQKTGAGYYRYEPGIRSPIVDPVVDEIVEKVAAQMGVTRRVFSDEEILDRTLLPVVNEGFRVLEEGIAAHAGDIDVILANGYGWPAWRGGPMLYSQTRGLQDVAQKLVRLANELGDSSLEPSCLLIELANSAKSPMELRRMDWHSGENYRSST